MKALFILLLFSLVEAVPFNPPIIPSFTGSKIFAKYTLEATPFDVVNGWIDPSTLDPPYNNHPAICSALHYDGKREGRHVFYSASDDGPGEDCSNFNTEFRPIAPYGPVITRWHLADDEVILEEAIPLQVRPGVRLLNFPNATNVYLNWDPMTEECDDAVPIDSFVFDGQTSDERFDPEGLYRFADGRFLLTDESPSIAEADSKGQILVRYVINGTTLDTSYPTEPLLPPVTANFRSGRGLESLAVDSDEEVVWAMFQSSWNVSSDLLRVYQIDWTTRKMNAVYIYRQTDIDIWKQIDPTIRERDVRISSISWLSDYEMLVSERGLTAYLIYIVDFSESTNVLDLPEANEDDPLLESLSEEDFDELGIILPDKWLIVNSTTIDASCVKMEGMAVINRVTLALCCDTDFIDVTPVDIVQLGGYLPLSPRKRFVNCLDQCPIPAL